jgi:hypothetical protein
MAAYFNNNPVTLTVTSYTGSNENVATLTNNFPPLILIGRLDDGEGLIYDQYDSYIYDDVGNITQIFTVQDYNDESYQITVKFSSNEDDNVYVSDILTVDAFNNGSITLCNDVLDCFVIDLYIPVDVSSAVVSFNGEITEDQTVVNIKPLVVNFPRPPRVSPFNFEFRLAPTPITTATTSPSVVTTTPTISAVIAEIVGCPSIKCNVLGF